MNRMLSGCISMRGVTCAAFGVVAGTVGCTPRQLMPNPNVCVYASQDPFADVPPDLQDSSMEVLYATDRAPLASRSDKMIEYGYDRSKSLAFGSCTVTIGRNLSWDELVQESRACRRDMKLPMKLTAVHELARFPASPTPGMVMDTSPPGTDEKAREERMQAKEAAYEAVRRRLARTPRKEAFVFIHGVGNTFESSAETIAGLWHFMGRVGVPVVYSWPAGYRKGMVQMYTYDRESGEFTIFHLKHFLQELAACPDIEKIHLIGHSRGTDVLITALRELNLQYTGAGKDTRKELKLGNVVLAAADMDFEVISQRLMSERLHLVPERMVVYVSRTDRAMSAADWLMASKGRLGQMRGSDLGPERQKLLGAMPRLEIIDVHLPGGGIGHSYFYENPAASSDLIRLLKDNCPAGTQNCRPLVKGEDNIWDLYEDYGT